MYMYEPLKDEKTFLKTMLPEFDLPQLASISCSRCKSNSLSGRTNRFRVESAPCARLGTHDDEDGCMENDVDGDSAGSKRSFSRTPNRSIPSMEMWGGSGQINSYGPGPHFLNFNSVSELSTESSLFSHGGIIFLVVDGFRHVSVSRIRVFSAGHS